MSNQRILPTLSETGAISFSVLVNGSEVSQTYEFLSIVTHKEANRIPYARLVLKDGDPSLEDFEISNEALFVPGNEIEITAGYDGDNKTLFKGIIVKHGIRIQENASSVLQLECRDKAVKMTVGRKNKYFTDVKDSDVLEQLIQAHGLSASVEATDVKHPELVQYYCTDWDFLMSRAEVNGKLVLVNDGQVNIKQPKTDGSPSFNLLYGDTLYEFEAEMDARCQYNAVKCSTWDYSRQAIAEEVGQAPASNTLGNLSERDLAATIGLDSLNYQHSGRVLNGELKSWGSSQLVKSHLAKVVGRAKFRGVPTLKPGDLLGFEGVGNRFNGKGYITAVRHSLVDGQFYTDAQFGRSPDWFYQEYETRERPAAGLLPGISGLQIGKVTQLQDDPDGEFRIQVRLPLIDSQAPGVWARLASLECRQRAGLCVPPRN